MRVKQILLLIFVSIYAAAGNAQNNPAIDSLNKVMAKQSEDSNKVKTLYELSKQYLKARKLSEGKQYALDALALSKRISFSRGELIIHRHIGMMYIRQGNYPEARNSFHALLKASEAVGNKTEAGVAYMNIGNSYFQEANYPDALINYHASLEVNKEIGNHANTIMAFNNIGLAHWNAANYPDAYKFYGEALKIRQQINDEKGIAHSYNVLGIVYDDEGNYPEALKNYLASLNVYKKLGHKSGLASCYNNIGELYRKQNNPDEALKNYEASIQFSKEINDQGLVSMTYNNMAGVYKDIGNYQASMKNCEAALAIDTVIGNTEGVATSNGNMAYLFYELGKMRSDLSEKEELFYKALKSGLYALKLFEEINFLDGVAESKVLIGSIYTDLKKYEEAGKFLKDGLHLTKKRGVKEQIKNSYAAMARYDSATGNWEGAYENHKNYILIRDSSVNEENTGKILRMQVQYEFTKKEDSLYYMNNLTGEKLKQQTLLAEQGQQTLLLNQKQLELLNKEKELQHLQIQTDKAEADKKHEQLLILKKEQSIHQLQLKKQEQTKNYLVAGLILFAILSFFVYGNYRTRQKLKLQTLRNKIATDLHDDIGSTLSSISIFSQMALQESKEVRPMLQTIGESSRKMLDAMADIVWTIKPENDQFEKIILRMRSFAYELLGVKNIEFRFVADDNVANMKLSMEARRNLYLIFKEATNNLVKYSEANKAMFSIKGDQNKLVMMISDDGKGFDSHTESQGNGLKNMKKRAEEMRAVLLIDTYPGKGTTIKLEMAV